MSDQFDGKFIYFMKVMRDDGPVKIGCSCHPVSRIDSFRTWCPYPLEIMAMVPGGFDVETQVHSCFADLFLHREWFRPEPRLMDAIAKLQAGMPLAEAIDLTDVRGNIRAEEYRRRGETTRANNLASKAKWAVSA